MKKIFGFCVVLILSVWIVRPLFSAGYFPMHDDTQVARVVVMGNALRQGQFPVRWVSDLGYGYGYPIFNFYGPLPYYVGGILYAIGLSGLVATKIMMGMGLVLAGLVMYLAISDMVGVSAGMLAAAFYMFAPYHAVQAYVRGAVGEYWSLIFLPYILWGFWKITVKKSLTSGVLFGSLGITGLILSHTILGYVGVAFIIFSFGVFWLFQKVRGGLRSSLAVIVLVFLGLGLSAFFWLPAITEMRYTNVSGQIGVSANFRDHFICPFQLWDSPWGFGGSTKGCLDGLSFKLGKIHVLTGIVAMLMWMVSFVKYPRKRLLGSIGFGITVVALFFTLSISQPIWEILPFFAYVQYPWRFLTFAIFGISLMSSEVVGMVHHKVIRWVAVVFLVGALLFIEGKRFSPQYTYVRPEADFESIEEIRFRISKISDEYLSPDIKHPQSVQDIVRDTIPKSDLYEAEMVQQTDTYEKFAFNARQEVSIRLNKAYFPGWHYMVNGKDTSFILQHGLPVIVLPKGESVVEIYFSNTFIRWVANGISIVSLIIYFYLYDQKNKKAFS